MKKLFYILALVLLAVPTMAFADLTILDSEENVDPEHESPDHHIAALDISSHIPNDYTLQEKIDEINLQGGEAILAHPNYGSLSYSIPLLLSLNNYLGIEALNGYCYVRDGGQALDKWDAVLSSGRKIWAYGVDDSHKVDQRGIGRTYVYGQGDIWDNYKNGNCYTALNSSMKYIYISYYEPLKRITVKVSNPATIKFVGKNSTIYETRTNSTGWSYNIQGNEGYIRVQAVSTNGRAFTQPFWIEDGIVTNPYQVADPNDVLSFTKANTHCHGDYQDIVNWYSTNGYSLLAVTNYNRISYPFDICEDMTEE